MSSYWLRGNAPSSAHPGAGKEADRRTLESAEGITAGRETPRPPYGGRQPRVSRRKGRECQTDRRSDLADPEAPPARRAGPALGARPEVNTACVGSGAGPDCGGPISSPRGARSPARGRGSAPARVRDAPTGRAAADNGCRRARSCRCAPHPVGDEAGRDLGGDRLRRTRARRAGGARQAWRAGASRPGSPRSRRQIRGSALRVYSRFTVASVPSTETSLVAEAAQAGLIAGTVPTKGTAKLRPQRRQHDGRGGVAGDHHEVRLVRRNEPADHATTRLTSRASSSLRRGTRHRRPHRRSTASGRARATSR